jgi:hypothetical protein
MACVFQPAVEPFPPSLRDARDRIAFCSGREHVVGGEVVVVQGDGGGHDAMAVTRDSVEASSWNLGDEAVATQLDDQT